MLKSHEYLKQSKKPRAPRPHKRKHHGLVIDFSVAPEISDAESLIGQIVAEEGFTGCCEKMALDYHRVLTRTDIEFLEDAIEWGWDQHQYLGNGDILSIDWEPVVDIYKQALSIAKISVSENRLLNPMQRFPRMNSYTKRKFRLAFQKLFLERITATRTTIDSLHSAKVIYADSTRIIVDGTCKLAKIHWGEDGEAQMFGFAITTDLSFKGVCSAFELYMRDGTISSGYSTPLAVRYSLDKNLIAPGELNTLLEHDLGL